MVKVEIEDAILLLVIKRKVDPVTDKDCVMIMQPTNQQDAIRINLALTAAQKTLLELTKKAVLNGAKNAENSK